MQFLSSPLEQFQILPIVQLHLGIFDFSITNVTLILTLGIGSVIFVLYSLLSEEGNFSVVPNRIQFVFEMFYELIFNMLNDVVGPAGKKLLSLCVYIIYICSNFKCNRFSSI
jgi:F-type H+-transporting ATPase subunit a